MSHSFEPPESFLDPILENIPYQFLVEQSLVGIYLIQDFNLVYCNAAFAAITGHKVEQVMGQPITQFVDPESLPTVLHRIRHRLAAGVGHSARYIHQAKHLDGRSVDMEVHGRTVFHDGRLAIAGVAIDVTQQMDYERRLKQSHDQLQQMTRYAIKLREQNRQTMAREIHDVLGGLLTSIKMGANRILKRQSTGGPETSGISEIAEDISTLAQESIDFARCKSEQLYPATLNYLGLVPSLKNLLKMQQRRCELECHLKLVTDIPRLQSDAELMVYRIVQESLTNVVRHAQASKVTVTLDTTDELLLVTVDDDGVGIREQRVPDGSFGLLFMVERAADFGGDIQVSCNASGGTQVALRLPRNAEYKHPEFSPILDQETVYGR